MKSLEAEVHKSLKEFLKQCRKPFGESHLTMARLISHILCLQRSAIIQTNSSISYYGLSYLFPSLLFNRPILLVAPLSIQHNFKRREIPYLRQWLKQHNIIFNETCEKRLNNFHGLLIVSPHIWLHSYFKEQKYLLSNTLTLIDRADHLEKWTRNYLTVTITPRSWKNLEDNYLYFSTLIYKVKSFLKYSISNYSDNPYQQYLLGLEEKKSLLTLCKSIPQDSFLNLVEEKILDDNYFLWASISRQKRTFLIHLSPLDLFSTLSPLLHSFNNIFIGEILDYNKSALIYRKNVGIREKLLCLKLSQNQLSKIVNLYIYDRLPMPNTSRFQETLILHIKKIVHGSYSQLKPILIIIDDIPLKKKVAVSLTSEFGSKIKIEKIKIENNYILISSWKFWKNNQDKLPPPKLLIIPTLPFPSLENPLVSSKVNYYKKQYKDWFYSYLLPTALQEMQRSLISLRASKGTITLLDNRINYRSYGKSFLAALQPYVKISYIK